MSTNHQEVLQTQEKVINIYLQGQKNAPSA